MKFDPVLFEAVNRFRQLPLQQLLHYMTFVQTSSVLPSCVGFPFVLDSLIPS
jgi:hypothetical protein